MNEYIWMYGYTMLLTLETILLISIPITLVVLLFAYIHRTGLSEYDKKELERINRFLMIFKSKAYITWIILSFAIIIAVPSKNDLITIAGGGTAIKATQVDGVDKLPKNLVKALNSFLEENQK